MRTLFPDELLLEIFLEAVVEDFHEDQPKEVDITTLSPWNIASTCASWRRVCLENSKLWAYIDLRRHRCTLHATGADGFDSASVLRICVQLERSGNSQLYLDATFDCTCDCVYSMFRAAAKACGRWRLANLENASLTAHNAEKMRDLLPTYPRSSQLASMTWYQDDGGFSCPLRDLTSLQSLTCHYFFQSTTPSFPWNQITDLSFLHFGGTADNILGILSQCPALTRFAFIMDRTLDTEFNVNNTITFEPNSVVLSKLEFLDLSTDCGLGRLFLPYLCLPNLSILWYEQLDNPSAEVLKGLIKRSSCSLTQFNLHLNKGEGNIAFLQDLPQLEYLGLQHEWPEEARDQYSCDNALRRLIKEDGVAAWCPHLKQLSLDHLKFDPILLVDVVESRENDDSVDSLQYLQFSLLEGKPRTRFCKAVIEGRLQKLVSEGGLEIEWTLKPDS